MEVYLQTENNNFKKIVCARAYLGTTKTLFMTNHFGKIEIFNRQLDLISDGDTFLTHCVCTFIECLDLRYEQVFMKLVSLKACH